MKMSKAWGSAALVVLALLTGPAAAQDRAQLERRAQSVGTLIEASSAARQVDSSGDPAARDKRDNARLMHREALAALASGDFVHATKLLDQAAREMMDGARLARPDQLAGEKARRDYDARLDSVRALLVAQRRIAEEKSAGAAAQDASRSIETQLADAERLAAAGKVPEARTVLDRAYLTARVSIATLRRGDTLVRSLSFSGPREEYDYELDRNDTHRMLIQVLLADRKEATASLQPFIDKAALLRDEALAQARRGEHPAAIRTLEESTRELVRAIRAGGIYIPG